MDRAVAVVRKRPQSQCSSRPRVGEGLEEEEEEKGRGQHRMGEAQHHEEE